MKFNYLFLLLSVVLITACFSDNSQEYDNQKVNNNKFTDVEFQKIYDLQNKRNTNALLEYLHNSDAKYRDAAALAFASVQDKRALNELESLLETDKSKKVRISAAFAIGQTYEKSAQKALIKLYKREKSDEVKLYIAEAIGKCGDTLGLDFLSNQLENNDLNEMQKRAVFSGIAQFFINHVYSQHSLNKLINYIDNNKLSDNNLYVAGIALARAKSNNIDNYAGKLIRIYNNTQNIYTKLNIVNAISKNKSQESSNFIKQIINSNCDYRLKVNAINSLKNIPEEERKPLLNSLLYDKNPNVSIRASEFILAHGNSKDIENYILESEGVNEWRTRTNLLAAALKYATNKSKVSEIIKTELNHTANNYEKAALLAALGYDIENYKYVSAIVHKTNDYVISTYGMEAIASMCNNPDFDLINKKRMADGKKDLKAEFAYILKNAIMSKDISRIAIAAGVIRNSKQNFVKEFENTYFLTQALNNCELPKDLEAYIELQKTIAKIKDEKFTAKNNKFPKTKTDWNFISQIPINQQIKIETNKGEIVIQLNVNDAPISVANILNLIKNKSFNNKYIHRVVPNFVVQDGCPRGDGWGSPDYTIYSEFANNKYVEGSLGMASAGKDTEASQWFITHSPTPHLDGRYTNFGTVISGMDVVHKLTVGDKIIKFTILNTTLN